MKMEFGFKMCGELQSLEPLTTPAVAETTFHYSVWTRIVCVLFEVRTLQDSIAPVRAWNGSVGAYRMVGGYYVVVSRGVGVTIAAAERTTPTLVFVFSDVFSLSDS